jgi:hypothetical protein
MRLILICIFDFSAITAFSVAVNLGKIKRLFKTFVRQKCASRSAAEIPEKLLLWSCCKGPPPNFAKSAQALFALSQNS